jgi:hypothetical protein
MDCDDLIGFDLSDIANSLDEKMNRSVLDISAHLDYISFTIAQVEIRVKVT